MGRLSDERSRAAWEQVVGGTPTLVGYGTLVFSSCQALERAVGVIHDVNGYYSLLGVDPGATRTELGQAYRARMAEAEGDLYLRCKLTSVVKLLLDPVRRAAYDAMPKGRRFLQVDELLLNDLVGEAQRLARQTSQTRDILRAAARILNDWGIELAESDPDDPTGGVAEDDPGEPKWGFAWYRWGCDCTDLGRLRGWVQALVHQLGTTGHRLRFAVGYHDISSDRWLVRVVGQTVVAYLHADWHPENGDIVTAAEAVATQTARPHAAT